MRPKSIVLFERLMLLSILLGLVSTFINWESMQEQLAAQGTPVGASTVLTIQGVGIVLYLVLLYFISRKGSPIAKWIYVILALLTLVFGLIGIGETFKLGALPAAFAIVGYILTAVTLWLLFRPDAKAWFSEGRGEADAETFR
jgi:hypothetical protein